MVEGRSRCREVSCTGGCFLTGVLLRLTECLHHALHLFFPFPTDGPGLMYLKSPSILADLYLDIIIII